jgi:hypothetical protein
LQSLQQQSQHDTDIVINQIQLPLAKSSSETSVNLDELIEDLENILPDTESSSSLYDDEYKDFINYHQLTPEEQKYFWKLIQQKTKGQPNLPTFNDLVDNFNRDKKIADAQHKSIYEVTSMDILNSIPPLFNDDKSEPNPESNPSKKYKFIALAPLTISLIACIGYGISKAIPYIRKTIKEYNKRPAQVSPRVAPASTATEHQTPSLAITHQS